MCVYNVKMKMLDEESGIINMGKLCPEEKWPTEVLPLSSWLPTQSCDRDCQICPNGNKNFSISALSICDTSFSENNTRSHLQADDVRLFGQCQRVTFTVTDNNLRKHPFSIYLTLLYMTLPVNCSKDQYLNYKVSYFIPPPRWSKIYNKITWAGYSLLLYGVGAIFKLFWAKSMWIE